MKKRLTTKNRIAVITLAAALVIPTVVMAEETGLGMHAGAGSVLGAKADDQDDKNPSAIYGAGVHTVLTEALNADDEDELVPIDTDEDVVKDEKKADAKSDAKSENVIVDASSVLETIETDEPVVQIVIAKVEDAANVRQEPDEEAKVAGKLYAGCGGELIEQKDGWSHIKSGNLEGWTKDDFLYFGQEAEEQSKEVGKLVATVKTDALRIRKDKSEDAGVLDLASEGSELTAIEEEGDWVSVKYDGQTGYVAAQYVDVEFKIPSGKTMEEIAAEEKAKAEAAAKKAAAKKSSGKSKSSVTNQGAVATEVSDVTLLAALIQCEAGRESYEGQLAVGAVVMNRVRSGSYPNTISGVITAPSQFPPATNGRVASVLSSGPSASCVQAAQAAISGQSNVGTATHFGGSGSGIQIGNHNFW